MASYGGPGDTMANVTTERPKKSLLVVDDEPPIRRALVRLLERSGYDCAEAASADEARRIVSRSDVSLVLTDVNMPGGSGIELAEDLLRDHPDLAVIMVTGLDDSALAETALETGAYGYIIKPFESNEILINVSNALRRRALEIENRRHRQKLEGDGEGAHGEPVDGDPRSRAGARRSTELARRDDRAVGDG